MEPKRILIVEDDDVEAKIITHNVERLKHKVIGRASDAESALNLFKTQQPDLVLLDFNLEDEIDGSELASELIKLKNVPVVFVTSADDESSFNKILKVEPDGFVQKPIHPREFQAVLELALYKKEKERVMETLTQSLDEKVKHQTKELGMVVNSLVEQMAENKKITEKLEQALEAERYLGQLKSRIISNLSHEFKTPLASIRSSAQLIQSIIRKGQETEKSLKHAERVQDAVDSLTEILNRILLVEKNEQFKLTKEPTLIDVGAFFESVKKEMNESVCVDVSADYSLHTDVENIETDPKLLRLILDNLISNACKYSEPGGEVYVNMEVKGKKLLISVADEGIGISEEDLPQIFDRFFRGENVGSIEGTGIGLSIMNRCLDLLGGEVKVESTEGKGSEFKVEIPLDE